MPGIIHCPNQKCAGLFEVPVEAIGVECKGCKRNFCSRCLDKPHQGNCQEFAIVKAREAVRNAGMDVRKCPFCGCFATKDAGCQHVTCIQCKKDWVFCCEQKRSPILAHGNHYHAIGCWCYGNYAGQDKYNSKCDECKSHRKVCPRPGNINMDLMLFNREAEEEINKRDRVR